MSTQVPNRTPLLPIHWIAASLLAAVTTLPALATTVVPPNDHGELAQRAEMVVLAKAMESKVLGMWPGLYTETRFESIEQFKGTPEKSFSTVVPGGERDGAGWLASGSPQFETGQTYLLFLKRTQTGEWQPLTSSYGILKEEVAADGKTTLLAPLREASALGVVPGDFEQIRTYSKNRLVPHLHAVAEGREAWDSAGVLAPAGVKRSQAALAAAPAGCALLTVSGTSVRWTAFDTRGTISIFAEATGDKSLQGGGFAELEAAAAEWSAINGSSVRVKYEGKKNFSLACTSNGIDAPPLGTNIVVFNDPCSDIPDLSSCGGTFAFGGPFYVTTEHTFAGEKRKNVVGWFVIVNNGVGCIGSDNYKLLLMHELGHGLGFAHTSDANALMNARCCNKLSDVDISCAKYLYPGEEKPVPAPETLVVPVVVDAATATTRYSSEVTLTNQSNSTVTATLRFTPSSGGAEAAGSVQLGPGAQRILPEILNWLRQQGAQIGSESQAGTLRVEITGAPAPGLVHAVVRTTAATSGRQPAGTAGLSYSGYPASRYDQTSATIFALRSNASDRSNLAVFNPGQVPVTVRVTAFAGDGSGRSATISENTTLKAFGWTQFNAILDGVQMSNGWVTVDRTSATGQFGAYGVINDNATNDGSFVEVTKAPASGNTLTVPILVETDVYQSELILANRGTRAATITLQYIESSRESPDRGQSTLTLDPGTQLIIPEATEFLRQKGLVGPRSEGAYVGALRMTVAGVPLSAIFAGARTSSLSPAGGRFGLFTPCVYEGQEATLEATVYGLRSDEENRSNVAVVNSSPGWASSVTLELRTFDGDAGGVEKGEPQTVSLIPGQLRQFNNILATRNIRNGWVKVTRIAGSAGWLAYGVVNDGALPGERTGDGAYISMVPSQDSSGRASGNTSNFAKGNVERVHNPILDFIDHLKVPRTVTILLGVLLVSLLIAFFRTKR